MSQQYLFNEPGSIPGIPGSFAHCRVEVDEAGNVDVQPKDRHPAYVPGEATAPVEAEGAPEQQTPTPPEQTTPPVQVMVSQGG